ncbi:MAG: YihY/virulence factor BrkB family protein [bacterium]
MRNNIKKLKQAFFNTITKSKTLKIIWETGYGFYVDDGVTFAAGISFYFLLSFIPFLILLGATTGYVVDYVQDIHSLTNEEMKAYIMNYLNAAIPFLSEKYVLSLINISEYKASLTTIGLVSLAVSATLLFSTLHYCFFRIFGGKSINFILSRLMGIVFLLTITILLFFLHYMTTIFTSVAKFISESFPSLSWLFEMASMSKVYGLVFSTVIIIFLFGTLLYYFSFGAKKSKRAMLAGALLFSFLWNGAKLLYNFYITKIANFSLFYGSAAWIITSILWVYYSALILLISMEFIKALIKVFPSLIDEK